MRLISTTGANDPTRIRAFSGAGSCCARGFADNDRPGEPVVTPGVGLKKASPLPDIEPTTKAGTASTHDGATVIARRSFVPEHRLTRLGLPVLTFFLLSLFGIWLFCHERAEVAGDVKEDTSLVRQQLARRMEQVIGDKFRPLRRMREDVFSGVIDSPSHFRSACRAIQTQIPDFERLVWLDPSGRCIGDSGDDQHSIGTELPREGEWKSLPAATALRRESVLSASGQHLLVLPLIRKGDSESRGTFVARIRLAPLIERSVDRKTRDLFGMQLLDDQNQPVFSLHQAVASAEFDGTEPVAIPGATWALRIWPSPAFWATQSYREAWAALIGVQLLALIVSMCQWLALEHWRLGRAHAAAIEALNDVAAAITSSELNAHSTLQRVTDLAAQMLGMPMVSLNIYNAADRSISVVYRRGGEHDLPNRYCIDQLPANKQCLESGELLFIGNLARDAGRFDQSRLRQRGIQSLVVLPLMVKKKPIGSISLFDRRPRRLTSTQLRMATLWAAQAAIIVRSAELLDQTRADGQTKTILLRELNHRVKNNLSGIVGLLSMSPTDLPDESRRWIDRVIDRIETMARVHELFVNGATAVTLPDLIRKAVQSIEPVRPAGVQIQLDLQGDPIHLRSDKAVTLAMVLHELCFNALRHGVGEQGTITVQSRVLHEGRIQIEVIDDGGANVAACDFATSSAPPQAAVMTGCEQKTAPTTGIGLSLVRGLVSRELHGEFKLVTRPESGSRATIELSGLERIR